VGRESRGMRGGDWGERGEGDGNRLGRWRGRKMISGRKAGGQMGEGRGKEKG